jgi:hypothetical protein
MLHPTADSVKITSSRRSPPAALLWWAQVLTVESVTFLQSFENINTNLDWGYRSAFSPPNQ